MESLFSKQVDSGNPGQTSGLDQAGKGPQSEDRGWPLISAVWDRQLVYPSGEEFYSPGERYPEYRLQHLSRSPNDAYRAVRSCLANAGLDAAHFGTAEWNPLGAYIQPGNKVFVLCNFVKHDDQGRGPVGFSAKCTHGSVLRAVLDYVLLALRSEGTVTFGNAPIQSCDWTRVLRETGAARVEEFYRTVAPGSVPVRSLDLRRHVVRDGIFRGLEVQWHAEDKACVEVDLGKDSLLESFYSAAEKPRLRVLDYDPRRTEKCHDRGRHIYILHREILESDVVLSIPKLKTHEKVGLTAGLKGCVGTVAHKDCLAHHRRGAPKQNGDEYPDRLAFVGVLSALHDFANLQAPGWTKGLAHSVDVLSRKVLRRFSRAIGGSWSGNDTCWRMALDLARILAFADKNGVLRNNFQRRHLVVTDGIVAGEGNGPLSPTPVQFGYVSFADNVAAGDHMNCLAMGFDPERLPLIRHACLPDKRPLVSGTPGDWIFHLNGSPIERAKLRRSFDKPFAPPREWRDWLSQ